MPDRNCNHSSCIVVLPDATFAVSSSSSSPQHFCVHTMNSSYKQVVTCNLIGLQLRKVMKCTVNQHIEQLFPNPLGEVIVYLFCTLLPTAGTCFVRLASVV